MVINSVKVGNKEWVKRVIKIIFEIVYWYNFSKIYCWVLIWEVIYLFFIVGYNMVIVGKVSFNSDFII